MADVSAEVLMWYRVGGGSGGAQQLRRQLPHRRQVEGRRAALDLCWLNLLLLPGRAVRSEHRLHVIRLKRPASSDHGSRSEGLRATIVE